MSQSQSDPVRPAAFPGAPDPDTVDVTRDAQGQALFEDARAERIKDSFYRLVCVMERLRSGCPWDRKQTPASLKKYVLEEAYEVLEAIETEDWDLLREELGDFSLQAVFQAKIQEEADRFTIEDVMEGIVDKMIRRHPHVFGDLDLAQAEDVEANWDQWKRAEKGHTAADHSALDGLTKGLPALLEAYKIAKKAAKVGFDWDRPRQVIDKIHEELNEVEEALASGDGAALQEELCVVLFAAANLVRKAGFEPEETLRLANAKFSRRFRRMERLAGERGQVFAELPLEEQETLWQAAKRWDHDKT